MRTWILAVVLAAAAAGAAAWFLRPTPAPPAPTPPRVPRKPSAEREAIDRGLDWLASAQEPDGHWWCARWSAYKTSPGIPGVGTATVDYLDPALTGLALLPFLYDGNTTTKGRHAAVVQRAISYLRMMGEAYVRDGAPRYAKQQPGMWHWGMIVGDYNPAVVYAALAEALLRTGQEDLRPVVEGGVEQMVTLKREDRPWASTLNPYDIGAAIFWVQFLQTAEACGVSVSGRARADARAYLQEMTEESTGRIVTKDVCTECLGGWDAQCVAILMRAWIDPASETLREKEMDTIAAHAPVWETRWKLPEDASRGVTETYRLKRDIVNFYFWYYGSLALERHGGARREPWRRALLAALLPNQAREGDLAGSWEPADPWGTLAGRVYSTAYAVMALQVPSVKPR